MARKKSPHLTDAELRLMDVLWQKGEATVLRRRLAAIIAALSFMIWTEGPGMVISASPPKAVVHPARTVSSPSSALIAVLPQAQVVQQTPRANPAAPNPAAIVRIPVLVTERLGRYVSGLQKEHFKIFEDDVEQNITEFSEGGALSIALVYAIRTGAAGSGVLRDAISELKKMANADDQFWLVYGSNDGPESPVRFDQSDASLDEILNRLQSEQNVPPPLGQIVTAADLMKSAKHSRKIGRA